jgi:triosephosphate isomerase
MREPLIAGNWKMNCTVDEAVHLVSQIREHLGSVVGVQVVVCPPFVDLHAVRDVLRETSIRLGAQDVFYHDSGAYTGAVSPAMLEGLCSYVIVGHSERRNFFGETDADVAAKVAAVQRHAITPIVCIGETLEEFESGRTSAVLHRQVTSALENASPAPDVVIAYEPVWAIGTGRSADPDRVGETAGRIRNLVAEMWGAAIADGIRILYGGSVSDKNISGYVRQIHIDGALVGGASLRPSEFCDIVFNTASTPR